MLNLFSSSVVFLKNLRSYEQGGESKYELFCMCCRCCIDGFELSSRMFVEETAAKFFRQSFYNRVYRQRFSSDGLIYFRDDISIVM